MPQPRNRVPVTCSTCNKSFEVVPSRANASPRLFCSMACRNVGLKAPRLKRTARVIVRCAVCGGDKEVTASYAARNATGMFFCSDECQKSKGVMVPRPARRVARVPGTCAACGTTISITPGRHEANTTGLFFCSGECRRSMGVKPRTLPDLTCEVCSTTFRSTDRTARFCSKPCHDSWQSRRGVFYPCAVCGKKMRKSPSQSKVKTCSLACQSIAKVKRAIPGRWHNGKPAKRTNGGYVMVYQPDHPAAHKKGGWILEHRLVMSQHVGYPLPPTLDVHHINGIKDDNRIENLALLDPDTHTRVTLAEASMRRRADQKRIQELEAENARIKELEAEVAALKADRLA